jgi:hypothetical protein
VGGVPVELVQLDTSGNVVVILAMGTTDSSGNYTLTTPAGFTPGTNVNYVVQAVGTTTLQAFVTGTSVNVDPYTHATVELVTGTVSSASVSLTNLAWAAINGVQQTVLQTSGDVSTSGTTASQLVSGLKATINNSPDYSNIVSSIAAAGVITGTVTDSASAPVANAMIMVRTFASQTTMAVTRTDASGNYTVHVPAGNYTIGALNDTSTSTAASLWWTSSGGTTSLFGAGEVTVGTTPVTVNFSLPAGGRISGTVTGGSSSNPLPGILVTLSDFASGQTLMFIRTMPDGTYNFNVKAGTYYLTFRNQTLQPYATAEYSSTISGGGTSKTQADKITITTGSSQTINLTLAAGYMVSGYVYTDTSDTTPVAGISVRFQDSTGAFAESTATQLDGSYRMWMKPGTYAVAARGQISPNLAVTSNVTQNFDANVAAITGVIKDTGGNPIPQVQIQVDSCPEPSPTTTNPCASGPNPPGIVMLGYEFSYGDGTFTVYANPAGNSNGVLLVAVVSDGRPYGSVILNPITTLNTPSYNNNNYPNNGNPITGLTAGGSSSIGTITMPDGAILSGTVTVSNTVTGNQNVQIRYGGSPSSGNNRLVNVRTMSDGSYTVSLPAGSTVRCVYAYAQGYNTNNNCGSGSSSSTGNFAWYAGSSPTFIAMGAQNTTYSMPTLAY